MAVFKYYELRLKLMTEQLGTCPAASIYKQHVQQVAKREIARANRVTAKLAKSLQKYAGVEVTDEKLGDELRGIMRAYMEMTGVHHDLSDDPDELIEQAKLIQAEYEAAAKGDRGAAPTVFMRDRDGFPVISSHMILGCVKEILRISVNNGDKSVAKSKVSVGELGALDLKVVEEWVRPSNDVVRDEDGKPQLLERPIRFERMGKTETAICRSEVLPAGTEYKMTLRMRAASPLADAAVLGGILELGKNLGLGQWRGSGNKGAFAYKLAELKDFKDPSIPEGWN